MPQAQEIRVPDIGDFKDVEIIEVLVKPGDLIRLEDPMIALESDKATMEVPAPFAGTVKELKVKTGDRVSEGSVILILEPAGEAKAGADASGPAPATAPSAPPVAKPPAGPVVTPDSAPENSASFAAEAPASEEPPPGDAAGAARTGPERSAAGEAARKEPGRPDAAVSGAKESARGDGAEPAAKVHASPSIRHFARELGVDLGQVKPTGPKQRIVKEDVQAYVKQLARAPRAAAAPASGFSVPEMPAVDFTKFGPIETRPLSRIKKLSGANLHRNWVSIPHVTQLDEADITELEAFRKEQSNIAEKQGVKLTLLAFLMKASVAALKKHPDFNSSLQPGGENLILKQYYHIGVAVDTPDGLMVPVIRDVDRKGVLELAHELGAISARAREKKLSAREMQGGTFSISSLGGIGGGAFTPIINAPEVAILGVGRSAMRPVYQDGGFVPRLILPLSLSYDHRVIDGAAGARFITYLSAILSDIRRLVL